MRSIRFNRVAKIEQNDNSQQGITWCSLSLTDMSTGTEISEWYYVSSCSIDYFRKNQEKLSKVEQNANLVQEVYDEDALNEFAKAKFAQMQFTDWDDFYKKMSQEFVYED